VLSGIGNWIIDQWLGVVGVALAIIFFFRSRKSYIICYKKSSVRLIGGALPEYVSILADNTPITSLSKTTITLWNRGTKALTRDLVARSITVDVDEAYLIFSSSVINTTDSSIGAHVVDTKDPNRKTLEFNHLDKADGFQVELFHDSRVIPRVSGRILGHKKERNY
jgi:hypothetical protein